MENGGQAIDVATDRMYPVFRGLAIAKIPGNIIAGIVGVAPPTYSKWRTGKSRIPAPTLVFLTLLLADKIGELDEVCHGEDVKIPRLKAALKSILRHLHQQEAINATLHPDAVRQGARLFRKWWQETSSESECDLEPDRFNVFSGAMPYMDFQRQDVAS